MAYMHIIIRYTIYPRLYKMKVSLFACFILICTGKSFGFSDPVYRNGQQMKAQRCNKSLLASTSKFDTTDSVYYSLPLHSEDYKDKDASKLQSLFEDTKRPCSAHSTCPCNWVQDIHEGRVPRLIMKAECQKDVKRTTSNLACEGLDYIFPILKIETCHFGFTVYRQDWQNVTVACVPTQKIKQPLPKYFGDLWVPSQIMSRKEENLTIKDTQTVTNIGST